MPPSKESTRPPPTERSSYGSWAVDKLRLGDTDRQGHINNAAFATFAETGRIEFMRDEVPDIDREGLGFVVVRLEVDFRSELHWPGTIDIGTRLLAVGRTSWRLEHGMFDGERCVATAISVMVTIDGATRRATPLPEPLRRWLEARLAR